MHEISVALFFAWAFGISVLLAVPIGLVLYIMFSYTRVKE